MDDPAISAFSSFPQRVLICVEELHILRFIKVQLERQGHVTSLARTTDEAMESLRLKGFDFIFVDASLRGTVSFSELVEFAQDEGKVIILDRSEDEDGGDDAGSSSNKGANLNAQSVLRPAGLDSWINDLGRG